MSRHARYTPILRTKTAEWDALRNLSGGVRNSITPCLEILPRELRLTAGEAVGAGLTRSIQQFAIQVGRSWGVSPFFLDLSHINPSVRSVNGEHLVTLLGRAASTYGISPVLITRPDQDVAFHLAAQEARRIKGLPVAVRVNYEDLDKNDISERIESLLAALGLTYSEADLFVDCGVVDETPPDYGWLCSRIPRLGEWRQFIVAGGAFLQDLDGLAAGTRFHPRYDWLHWQAWLLGPRPHSDRIPTFSDYTIQHAVFREPIGGANPSASIRYAASDYWVIMRGEALRSSRNKAGHAQYYGNAQLLSEREEYSGSTYSFGDHYISEVASRRSGPGTPTTWLAAGINHHITLTCRQVEAI